ncbi:WD40/YVTN/BNR-like repeat-containing protein [Solimonas aquatica]|uniref:WD40/YVTN/BNR-like repeat-containing protein n=1 Tax=Solimonas aquatica TaxID=489703 RepID=UPI0015A5F611|nr:hypothetical protein [Solimonas aquatica]
MSKRLIKAAMLLMTLAAAGQSHAASVAKIVGGIPHDALFSVSFDGSKGVAVGAGGKLMVSNDAGKTWAAEAGPTGLAITAVAIKGSRRVMAGQVGEIYYDDGSGKWQKADNELKERAMGVAINSNGVAIVVGAFGMLERSTDGGKTWKAANLNWDPLFASSELLGDGFQPQLYAVNVDDTGLAIAVGELGTVIRSSDAGRTWFPVLGGNVHGETRPPTLFAVSQREDGSVFAVGQSGTIYKSADKGLTWCSIPSGTDANLFGVASLPGGKTVVSGMREMLFSSNDAEWERLKGEDIAVAWYSGVASTSSGNIIAVGQSGNILRVEP